MDDYEKRQVRRYRQARTVEDLAAMALEDFAGPVELFNVVWFDPDGTSHLERSGLTAEQAVVFARSLVDRPAARIGVFKRIIIIDQGGSTCFEWKFGEGVTYPTQEMRDAV